MPTPYYRYVLDALAHTGAVDKSALEAVRDVCVATEAKDRFSIRSSVKRIVRDFPTSTGLPLQLHLVPTSIWHETMFRLLELGETRSMLGLIKWYKEPYFSDRPKITFEGNNWLGMIQLVKRPANAISASELEWYWEMIERALAEAVPLFVSSEDPKPRPTDHHIPIRTALGESLVILFESLVNAFQLFLDRALEELATNGFQSNSQMRRLQERWTTTTRIRLLPPTKPSPKFLLELPIPKAKVLESRGLFSYLDAFEPHAARTFAFDFYQRGDDAREDPEVDQHYFLRDLLRFIDNKLNFYLDELGVAHKKPDLQRKVRKEDAVKQLLAPLETQLTLAARRKIVQKPKIDTDDELAQFACLLYLDHMENPPKGVPTQQDAWDRALGFLRRYLATQTTPTSFNLDERSTYVDRLFPRAINCGQIHDCGVYAVRMTNILLRFAACTARTKFRLDLSISFIILPLHVGLIVQGQGIQPAFVHNQVLVSLDTDQEKLWFDEWKNGAWRKDASDPDPADPDKEKEKFWEDVAAQLFMRDIDMPLLRIDLNGVSIPPRKGEVDSAYKRLVVANYAALFSSRIEREDADEFNFDLQFLDALATNNRWFNKHVRRLWNIEARELYLKERDVALEKSQEERDLYADELTTLVRKVDEAYDKEVRPKKEEVSMLLRAKQKRVLGRKAPRISLSIRLRESATSIGEVGEIQRHIDVMKKGFEVPRFVLEGEFLTPLTD